MSWSLIPAGVHRSSRRALTPFALLFLLALGTAAFPAPAPAQEATDLRQLQDQVARQTEEVQTIWDELVVLFEDYTRAQGEERLIIDAQIDRRAARFRPSLAELITSITRLEEAGGSAPRARARATEWLDRARELVRNELLEVQDRLSELRIQRSGLSRDQMLPVERQISQVGAEVDALLLALNRVGAEVDALLLALNRVGNFRASFGVDPASDWAYLDPLLEQRADRLVGEIELSQVDVRSLTDRLESAVGDEERMVRAELTAVNERLRAGTTGLGAVVDLMDQRELDATEYKQMLIQSTGQVTTDVLDWNVAVGLVRDGWRSLVEWTLSRAPQMVMNLLLFALILLVFRILARISGRVLAGALSRANPNMPTLLKSMSVSIVSNAVFLVGILIGLSQLGIHVGPLLAGLGVAGFIMGFALQDTLSNFASGMMILVYRPFDVGDVVEAGGVSGKVSHMSLVSTTILTFDNQKLIVPNREIWGNVIRNKTAEQTRRVDLTVSVGERGDVPRAMEILAAILEEHPGVLDEPEPTIRVHRLGEQSTDVIVRPWVRTEDYWQVYWDVTGTMNDRLEAAGVSRPFSRSELRLAGNGMPPAWAPTGESPPPA